MLYIFDKLFCEKIISRMMKKMNSEDGQVYSKNYLKRRYRIRYWIPMFIGTPCIYSFIFGTLECSEIPIRSLIKLKYLLTLGLRKGWLVVPCIQSNSVAQHTPAYSPGLGGGGDINGNQEENIRRTCLKGILAKF